MKSNFEKTNCADGMTKKKWEIRETDADIRLMASVLNVSEITARAIANRGIRSKNAAISFLAPSLEKLHDTRNLKDMDKALERVSAAVSAREKIMIYGDYDADGIMSTVILYKTLSRLGADCDFYMPHRIDEGYGLNLSAVKKIADAGVKLLIAVDNGISAVEEVHFAATLGIQTVIIDHHEPGEILPSAVAIVDPKQPNCNYPYKELCAAGLTYKFSLALRAADFERAERAENDEFLALAAIATLCDITPLTDENRIIVTHGLAVLNANKLINPGLGSLITIRGYLEKQIEAYTVGFVIGPCLNATGRLESAKLAVELLLARADELQKRMEIAQQLVDLNDARKKLTAECVERAMEKISGKKLPKVLVLTDFEAHESVAGIVAGRIRDKTCRPTILLTQGDGAVKGSARSVEGYNIFEALYRNRALFQRFGGHAMAAGLTLSEENIETLCDILNAECTLSEENFVSVIRIDQELPAEKITLALSDELARLAPFGKENSEPLFVSYGLYVENARVIAEKNTIIFSFSTKNGRRLKGIAFGLNDLYENEQKIDVVYSIETNYWNNSADVQIRIKDFKKSEPTYT
ncbi:MAG: single-stranded-DNA-specific exonuclease RecJ [Defluviitaleaceae bacterium]|nr:single-stranded-DNA-specific exonuclease RecJ [Defluviitaleaceae bacterium]